MQKIIDNMRGPLTCLVVFALMVMTPFADPQIALASDYAEGAQWSPVKTELLEKNSVEWKIGNDLLEMAEEHLPETAPVEEEALAMEEVPVVEETPANEIVAVMEVVEEISEEEESSAISVEADASAMEEEISSDMEEKASQKSIPMPQWRIQITNEQLDLLERCVMAEGGGESYECQVAIACVIINRVISDKYPDSVDGVIKQKGQFSTWPKMIKRMVATNEVKQAVREALTSEAIPENVLYFRASRYHKWGSRYCRIDNTYFSTP